MPHASFDSSYGQAAAPGNAGSGDDDLNARSAQWQRTGEPSVLWPGIDRHALHEAAGAIESSVASCLDGRSSSLGRPDGTDAYVIGVASLILGVGPLLGYWIERGCLDVSDPLAKVLAQHLTHGRARAIRIVNGVRPVVNALAEAGVVPVVIKGLHAAHAYFPEPGVRPFADVDLIVSPAEVDTVEHTLSSSGFSAGRASRPFKRQWFPPGVDSRIRSFELWHSESPWELELHGGLFFSHQHRYGVNFGEPRAEPCNIGGIEARALTPALRLATTAAHFSSELYSMRLLRLVEMVLMIRAVDAPNALEWTGVLEVLTRSRATRFVYPAFALIERLAPGSVPSHVLARVQQASTRLARHVVAQQRPATPLLPRDVSLAQELMWASTPVQFADRVGRLIVPDMSATWSEVFRAYETRLHRLFNGRVSFRFHR